MATARPRYGAPDGHGRYGILDHDDEGRVLCHECGRWWKHLATHLAGTHGMRAAAYREAHGLGASTPLVGSSVRQAMSSSWERNRPAHVAALDRGRDPEAARAASLKRAGERSPAEVVAARQARAAARRVDLTPAQIEQLGDPTDIAAWASRARRLIAQEGVSMGAISRASGLAAPTVAQRLRRYPEP